MYGYRVLENICPSSRDPSSISRRYSRFFYFSSFLHWHFEVRDITRYEATFANLEIERALDKVVLLHEGHPQALGTSSFQVSTLMVGGLFIQPESLPQNMSSPNYNNTGLISPVSPVRAPGGHLIDLSLVSNSYIHGSRIKLLKLKVLQPLHKRMSLSPTSSSKLTYGFPSTESPPPCNEHYLMVCSKGVSVSLYLLEHKYWELQTGWCL